MSTVIRLDDVSKRFVIRKDKSLKERVVNAARSRRHRDEFWALRDVDLEVHSGTSVGLIGPNGSGKSTLLKTIGGIIQPTSGTVWRRGRLAALLELGAGFHPDLTGRENVFLNAAILGLSRQQTEGYFDDIVDFSGIEPFIDTQVKFYSSGMYVRLAFAVAVHVDPDVLLVDEVLAVGDEPFQRKCMDRIRAFQREGRTIVLVSHALDQVADICDRAVVLEAGRVVLDGDPRDALRVLRADFEETRRADIARSSTHASESEGPVVEAEVLGVTLSDPSGTEVATIDSGDDVLLTVLLRTSRPVVDAVVGISLDTPLGQIVYGTSSRLCGADLPPLDGLVEVPVLLRDLRLGEGQYFVQAALAAASGEELHRLNQAALLTVQTPTRSSIGVLAVSASIGVPRPLGAVTHVSDAKSTA